DSLPPMRDHDAGPAVVRRIAVDAIENEPDEAIRIERADSEIRPVAAPDHQIGEVLGRVLRRNVVVAERIIERFGHRLEADSVQRPNLNHRAMSSASSRSRPNAERQMCESSGTLTRISGTRLRSMMNTAGSVRPIRIAGTPCFFASVNNSSS